jgi:MFS family permease
MLFLITYELLAQDGQAGAMMVQLAAGVFILPFLLFSGLAGQIADGIDKARVIRWVKTAEIGIMIVGAWALQHDSIAVLMVVLFLMGLHSTLFGPVKYAILPQHLGQRELLAGTGLVEAGTYVAILTGQVAGGVLGDYAAWGVLAVAAVGWLTGRMVPDAPARHPARLDWNIAKSMRDALRHLLDDRRLLLAALAVSWFWAMGAVYTGQFVSLVKLRLHADEHVATLFLTLFSIGVAAGSLGVNKLLRGEVSARFAPAALVAMTGFSAYLLAAAHLFEPAPGELHLSAFVAMSGAWHLMASITGLAAAAGVFVVPLYAMLQTICDPGERAQVIAANNILNSAFMVAAALAGAGLIAAGLSVLDVLAITALVNLAVLPWAMRLRRSGAVALG